jgi:hypothetical protein
MMSVRLLTTIYGGKMGGYAKRLRTKVRKTVSPGQLIGVGSLVTFGGAQLIDKSSIGGVVSIVGCMCNIVGMLLLDESN